MIIELQFSNFQYDICTKTELSPIRKDQDSEKIENSTHQMESFCLISNKVKILFCIS